MTVIYGLIDPVIKQIRYVGKSIDARKRFRSHICDVGAKTRCARWIRGLRVDSLLPELEILEDCSESGRDWPNAERDWIAKLKPLGFLTNHLPGGEAGAVPTPDGIARMSATKKAKFANDPEYRERFLAIRRSPETRAKISVAGKGRKHSDESRARMSQSQKKKKLTPEHKANIAIASGRRKYPGRKLSDAHKAALSASGRGKPKPASWVENRRGQTKSPEWREKIRQSNIATYARKKAERDASVQII